MCRWLLTLLLAAVGASQARAHFVFLVPTPQGGGVKVVFSDTLAADDNVPIARVADVKLFARTRGTDAAVGHKVGKHELVASVAPHSTVVYGTVTYGLPTRTKEPFLLVYHPKAVLDSAAAAEPIGAAALTEIVAATAGGKTRFRLLAGGKPVAGSEGMVLLPTGTTEKVSTDVNGYTAAFPGTGRFGVWLRYKETKAGEHKGTKYNEVRHYPTLTMSVERPTLPPLPAAVASHGAVVSDGYLYVYGGHSGKTHSYSTQSVIGTFQRLKLRGGDAWESLPGGPIAQGLNLTAHKGRIIRAGGMQPRNDPTQPTDNHSLRSCAAYDPKAGKWTGLPDLPAGRSSHDLVTVGDQLVVVGGWDLAGKGKEPVWHDTALLLDLSGKGPAWRTIPQPFKRRALTAAVLGTRVYVVGGLTAEGKASLRVDVLDTVTGKWTAGPEIPGDSRIGFSPAATVVGDRLIVSTSDGQLHALNPSGTGWVKVGRSQTHRRVHRLVPYEEGVLLIGGAGSGGMIAEVEYISLTPRRAASAAPAGK